MNNILYTSTIKTPFGEMKAGVHNGALCFMRFMDADGEEHFTLFLHETGLREKKQRRMLHNKVQQQTDEYFKGTRYGFSFPVRLFGTDAQIRLWNLITCLRPGEEADPLLLLKRAGIKSNDPGLVHEACVMNPVSIAVPVHRVAGIRYARGGAKFKSLMMRFEYSSLSHNELRFAA
jgi:O6-methylguanine-DNA--protein-cysteine methyltransferase